MMTFAFPRTCSSAWLRYVNSHGGQWQVGEPPALGLRERGHAEAPVQLVPLQRLEAWADPALQTARGHAACRGHHCNVEDEDGERSCKKHQNPHCNTWVLSLLKVIFPPFIIWPYVSTFVLQSSLFFWIVLLSLVTLPFRLGSSFLPFFPLIIPFLLCVHYKPPCPLFPRYFSFPFLPLHPFYAYTFDSSLLRFCSFDFFCVLLKLFLLLCLQQTATSDSFSCFLPSLSE